VRRDRRVFGKNRPRPVSGTLTRPYSAAEPHTARPPSQPRNLRVWSINPDRSLETPSLHPCSFVTTGVGPNHANRIAPARSRVLGTAALPPTELGSGQPHTVERYPAFTRFTSRSTSNSLSGPPVHAKDTLHDRSQTRNHFRRATRASANHNHRQLSPIKAHPSSATGVVNLVPEHQVVNTVPAHRYGPNGVARSRVITNWDQHDHDRRKRAKKNAATEACQPI